MIIHWRPNPLETRIELEVRDIEIFNLKFRISELEDAMTDIEIALDEAQDPRGIIANQVEDDEATLRSNIRAMQYVAILKEQDHGGDCTAAAASCPRCYAEAILGFSPITGLHQHEAYKIAEGFRLFTTLPEVIGWLEDYQPDPSRWPAKMSKREFNTHLPRWQGEATRAALWLRKYHKKHFPQEQISAA